MTRMSVVTGDAAAIGLAVAERVANDGGVRAALDVALPDSNTGES